MKNKKGPGLIIMLAFVMVAIGLVVGYGLGSNASPDTTTASLKSEDGLSIMSITENGEWRVLDTTYGKLRYPFAFSDIIEVEAFNEGALSELRFYAKIEGKKMLNYTIHFNDNEGIACGTLKLKDEIPVSVVFEDAPEGLKEDWLSTFYAVQETFNDVLKSMEENKKFSSD